MAKRRTGYGNKYCCYCGGRVKKGVSACPRCGAPYNAARRYVGLPILGAGGVGWSENLGDRSVKACRSRSAKGGAVFVLILTAILAAIAYFTDSFQGLRLYIFLGLVGAMWLAEALAFLFALLRHRNWEGTLENKRTRERVGKPRGAVYESVDENRHVEYILVFAVKNGKLKKMSRTDDATFYDYLLEGDRVRYHGALRYFEKYDKSNDVTIPCVCCGEMRDPRDNYCGACGTILLKGPQTDVSASAVRSAPRPAVQAAQAPRPAPRENAQGARKAVVSGGRRVCPNCGAPLTQTARFCIACGERVE